MILGEQHDNAYAACTVLASEDGLSYRLTGPRGSNCSVVEIDGYVGIVGDLSPNHNRGVWSTCAWSLERFAGATEADVLADRFLERDWYADLAEQQLRDWLAGRAAFPSASEIAAVQRLIRDRAWDRGMECFGRACDGAGINPAEAAPGVGYSTRDVFLLASLSDVIAAFRSKAPIPAPARVERTCNLGRHSRPGLGRP